MKNSALLNSSEKHTRFHSHKVFKHMLKCINVSRT